MPGDINGMMAVKTAIAGGETTVNVALEGAVAINDLLLEMKA